MFTYCDNKTKHVINMLSGKTQKF